eukprot:gene14675-biopygen11747
MALPHLRVRAFPRQMCHPAASHPVGPPTANPLHGDTLLTATEGLPPRGERRRLRGGSEACPCGRAALGNSEAS